MDSTSTPGSTWRQDHNIRYGLWEYSSRLASPAPPTLVWRCFLSYTLAPARALSGSFFLSLSLSRTDTHIERGMERQTLSLHLTHSHWSEPAVRQPASSYLPISNAQTHTTRPVRVEMPMANIRGTAEGVHCQSPYAAAGVARVNAVVPLL
jgi:hypothetical protein